jgi:arylsulfatase A-like enzyme
MLLCTPALAERPNIILIMADDMGYSDIGCYGGEIPTPNIDGLASGGLRFTEFYNTGRCCPTRASLMTGLYPHEAGVGHMVYSNRGPGYLDHLNDRCVTIAEVLGAAGYQTMMTGKWHVGHAPGQWPSDRGFEQFYGIHIHVDSYFKVLKGCPVYHNGQLAIPPTTDPPNTLHPGEEWYTTDVFTDWALKFLGETNPAEKPFFLYVAYNSPHWPLEAPDENVKHFRGKYGEGWDTLRETKLARMKKMGIVTEGTVLSPSENPTWDSIPEADQVELDFRRAIYSGQIERMDQNVGRIVAKLDRMGVMDNTLILFLSDNGCCAEGGMFGYKWGKNRVENHAAWRNESARSSSTGQAWACASNTPFRLYKRWVHEGGIATPLIAHWPSKIRGTGELTQQPGHVVDIMATCCDVGEANYPKIRDGEAVHEMRGISLLPTFENPAKVEPRTLYWEHEQHAAIRDGNWKLVSLNGMDETQWRLYDLDQDRSEMHDRSEAMPERVKNLKQRWTKWARETDVLPWPRDRKKK